MFCSGTVALGGWLVICTLSSVLRDFAPVAGQLLMVELEMKEDTLRSLLKLHLSLVLGPDDESVFFSSRLCIALSGRTCCHSCR